MTCNSSYFLMRTFLSLLALSIFFVGSGCQSSEVSPDAGAVIDSARSAHGASVLQRATVEFQFRGDDYQIRQNEGQFHYQRAYTDSLDRSVTEGLTNEGVYRVVEDDTLSLSSSERADVKTTVNSVSYFALIPEPLDEPAVQATYSGRDTIEGESYHRVRVTFQREGGGDDWQDIFLYWFHTDTYAMDYVAYAYGLGPDEEDAGTRFRKAYNVRRVNGVRMADYRNYTADTLAPDRMAQYPALRNQDALELVSNIEIDSVRIRPL